MNAVTLTLTATEAATLREHLSGRKLQLLVRASHFEGSGHDALAAELRSRAAEVRDLLNTLDLSS